MALSFNGTSDYLSNSTLKNTFGGASAISIAFWGSRSASNIILSAGFQQSLGGSDGARCAIVINNDATTFALVENGASAYGSVADSRTGWTHYALTFDGAGAGNSGRLQLCIDGVQKTLVYGGTIPSALQSAANLGNFEIGRWAQFNRFSTGAFAEVGAWTAALSPSEVAALAKGYPPHRVRLANLAAYLPLIRDVVDLKGNAWTTTGTTVSTHPRRIG